MFDSWLNVELDEDALTDTDDEDTAQNAQDEDEISVRSDITSNLSQKAQNSGEESS